MLYLDAPLELNGLYVYRDYSNKARFYYLSKSPRLSMEGGQPMFQLLVYRDVSEPTTSAGGFLTMTTDLGVSSATITKTESELSGRFGMQATLAPVPVKGGSVRVTALDSGTVPGENGAEPRFVESLIAPGKPSLYGDQRAAFTVELSGKGAQLMKVAIEGDGATPVVLLYELQFMGLLPAYDVTIKIKFRQVYEHLRQRSQMNTLWFRSDSRRCSAGIHDGHDLVLCRRYAAFFGNQARKTGRFAPDAGGGRSIEPCSTSALAFARSKSMTIARCKFFPIFRTSISTTACRTFRASL